jgi:hypothetical protein
MDDKHQTPASAEHAAALEDAKKLVAADKAFHPKDANDYPGKIHFPKWLYGPKGEARIVASPAEAAALGKGWFDNPDPEGKREVPLRSDRSEAEANATRDANERAEREDAKKK